MNRQELIGFPWYHGVLSREVCNDILWNGPLNSWLIRVSTSSERFIISKLCLDKKKEDRYTLDPIRRKSFPLKIEKKIKHFIIHEEPNKNYYLTKGTSFKKLTQLVEYYKKNPIHMNANTSEEPFLDGPVARPNTPNLLSASEQRSFDHDQLDIQQNPQDSEIGLATSSDGEIEESQNDANEQEDVEASGEEQGAVGHTDENLQFTTNDDDDDDGRNCQTTKILRRSFMRSQEDLTKEDEENELIKFSSEEKDSDIEPEPSKLSFVPQTASEKRKKFNSINFLEESVEFLDEKENSHLINGYLGKHQHESEEEILSKQLLKELKQCTQEIMTLRYATNNLVERLEHLNLQVQDAVQKMNPNNLVNGQIMFSPKHEKIPNPGNQLMVIEAYSPKYFDELEINVGDIITFLDEIEPGWWRGKCNSKIGLFPSTTVKLLKKI